jgi:hypothetical protein
VPSGHAHAGATLQQIAASAPSPSPRLEPKDGRNRADERVSPIGFRRPGSGEGDAGGERGCREAEPVVVTVGGQNKEGVQVIAVNTEDVNASRRDHIGKLLS